MNNRLPHSIRKKQTLGLILFGILIGVFQLGFSYYKNQHKPLPPKVNFISSINKSFHLQNFNPNTYSELDWKNIGFTEKQVATILKYKEVVGGEFKSKEQLKKCYAISEEKFNEIEPFILLPEKNSKKEVSIVQFKKLSIKGKFNPDNYTINDWMSLGFTEKQSQSILKYKNYLGGSFQSKEKLKECYTISDEHFRQLAPYLILPDKSTTKNNSFETKQKSIVYHKFNPNDLDLEGWQNLGFSLKQSEGILKYKNSILKGQFKTLEDLKKCYMISEKKWEEIKSFVDLPLIVNETITGKKEVTDFTKIDLNSVTFNQLKEFGFDDKAAATYLNFRKKLGGFADKKQILETYNLDTQLAEKLVKTAHLDISKVKKYTLQNAPEEWLKEHPYFKYSAEKIIQLRKSHTNDADIWKILRLKNEYEKRMKLYLE